MSRAFFFSSLFRNHYQYFTNAFSRKLSLKSYKPFYSTFFEIPNNTAVIDNHGSFSYKDILCSSFLLAEKIKKQFPDCREKPERISFLCSNDATYVTVMLSCWITGNVAVPLCSSHPQSLLEYYIKDSQSNLIIANEEFVEPMQAIAANMNTQFLKLDHDIYRNSPINSLSDLSRTEFFSWDSDLSSKRALIIYTSGTTGNPKGVVLTHGNLHVQVAAVVESWKISAEDAILHALPLHHIHGIMNALLCPLSVGGTIVMQKKFNALEAWKYFLSDPDKPRVNLFFAVPTMYAKLIENFQALSKSEDYTRKRCSDNMRLMSSGSMALPVPAFQRWEEITGHRLLERFGMSEIGMALANPLGGPRLPGFVGVPLPDVELKIRKYDSISEDSYTDVVTASYNDISVLPDGEGTPGELLIRGPNVFKEYWKREKATHDTFAEDNWFKTGDTACYETGSFKILGRTSVDIIKSGGYKISALEVESCLLRHPNILECTVFGLPDDTWGERVAAIVKFQDGASASDDDLKQFCRKHIPRYSVPTVIKRVDVIPRNVMGKVNKKELKSSFVP